jgi:hypothetical protein
MPTWVNLVDVLNIALTLEIVINLHQSPIDLNQLVILQQGALF